MLEKFIHPAAARYAGPHPAGTYTGILSLTPVNSLPAPIIGGIEAKEVIEVKPLQPLNAYHPIFVIDEGSVMDVRFVQPSNAPKPIETTLLGMIVLWQPSTMLLLAVEIIALQLSRLSKTRLLLSTSIEVNDGHPTNALYPIFVTELDIVIELISLQPENANVSIVNTWLGIITEVRP